jgi:hypothetical protein
MNVNRFDPAHTPAATAAASLPPDPLLDVNRGNHD